MARRPASLTPPLDPTIERPGSALVASFGEKPARPARSKHTPSATKRQIERAREELAAVVEQKSRPGEPRHLVALYTRTHETVYGVFPDELREPREWLGAVSAARRLLAECFAGDFAAAVAFLRWTWARELDLVRWKREREIEIKRITWRKQFVFRDLVTDYRASLINPSQRSTQ